MKAFLQMLILFLMMSAMPHASGVEIHLDKVPVNLSDSASLQRGAQLFTSRCLACHSAAYMRYNRLEDIGMTEEQIIAKGIAYKKGEFPMSVNGKAMAEYNTEGFVKVLAEEKYGEVLGVHIVAARAIDMIHEAVLALQLEATMEDVARVVHAHPSMSETFVEADFSAMDKPLHI